LRVTDFEFRGACIGLRVTGFEFRGCVLRVDLHGFWLQVKILLPFFFHVLNIFVYLSAKLIVFFQ